MKTIRHRETLCAHHRLLDANSIHQVVDISFFHSHNSINTLNHGIGQCSQHGESISVEYLSENQWKLTSLRHLFGARCHFSCFSLFNVCIFIGCAGQSNQLSKSISFEITFECLQELDDGEFLLMKMKIDAIMCALIHSHSRSIQLFLNRTTYSHSFHSDLEWKIIYVGKAEDSKSDIVLDEILVGPVPRESINLSCKPMPPRWENPSRKMMYWVSLSSW